jgi:hypothetical protein
MFYMGLYKRLAIAAVLCGLVILIAKWAVLP